MFTTTISNTTVSNTNVHQHVQRRTANHKAKFGLVKASLVSLVFAAGMTLTSGAASAASPCKGLDTSACGANASCGWVQGYERKDGRKVSAFCRTKPKSQKRVSNVATPSTNSGK